MTNLVNQRPIGKRPNDPDDGASQEVPQGHFQESKNPRKRVEFIQKIVVSSWKWWTRNAFPLLVPRGKWNLDRRNVRVDDVVVVQDGTAVRGKWIVGRMIDVFPGKDTKVT